MRGLFAETHQIVPLLEAIDWAAGANTGDWISMKNFGRCAIVITKEPGPTGNDPTFTLLQATTVAGGSSKALNITRVDKKQAASNLAAVGTFTKSTSASPASNDTFSTNTWTNSDLGEQALLAVIDIAAEDLDVDNGFDCISITIADTGSTGQLGAVLAFLYEPRYAKEGIASAIVD